MSALAIHNGRPVRDRLLPYCLHYIEQDDIDAVENVLRHGWLTNGPRVQEFESLFAEKFNVKNAVSFSSGTTALLGALNSLKIGPGDEVIVPTLTFVASANCILSVGAKPVFCDVDPKTLLIDCDQIAGLITRQTKAIIAVDYAGQPCDYDALSSIARKHELLLISDASHSVGARHKNVPVGGFADVTAFSFHPTKNITTGEGGMITTNSEAFASKARLFRSHGLSKNPEQQSEYGTWHYDMVDLGYNYRLSDINCALGISQLHKLDKWILRRNEISRCYREGLKEIPQFIPLLEKRDVHHAYHLFIVKINPDRIKVPRAVIFSALQGEGIGVNVHYTPVHLQPFYRNNYGTHPGLCPRAEYVSNYLLTLPMFSQMTDEDIADVLKALAKVGSYFSEIH
jgi:perosamine synthetase